MLMKFIFYMELNIKVSYNWILTFLVCLARPNQSTYNSSVWVSIMQQKVTIFNLGEQKLISQTLKKELIISWNFFELEVVNIVNTLFTLNCFTYVRISFFFNEKFTSCNLLFYKKFDCNVGTFPLIQNGYFFLNH